jgi:hypothetical protein
MCIFVAPKTSDCIQANSFSYGILESHWQLSHVSSNGILRAKQVIRPTGKQKHVRVDIGLLNKARFITEQPNIRSKDKLRL